MEKNPFEALGWSEEDAEKVSEAIKEPSVPRKDPRVCLCGHPARAHSTEGITDLARGFASRGFNHCRFARMKCPCAGFVEIGTSSDVRVFTFKTAGPDKDHALLKGIKKAQDAGAEFEWTDLSKTACLKCGATSGARHIVALDSTGHVSPVPEAHNLFLCDVHFAEMGGNLL